jgi:hypothetical protein
LGEVRKLNERFAAVLGSLASLKVNNLRGIIVDLEASRPEVPA